MTFMFLCSLELLSYTSDSIVLTMENEVNNKHIFLDVYMLRDVETSLRLQFTEKDTHLLVPKLFL